MHEEWEKNCKSRRWNDKAVRDDEWRKIISILSETIHMNLDFRGSIEDVMLIGNLNTDISTSYNFSILQVNPDMPSMLQTSYILTEQPEAFHQIMLQLGYDIDTNTNGASINLYEGKNGPKLRVRKYTQNATDGQLSRWQLTVKGPKTKHPHGIKKRDEIDSIVASSPVPALTILGFEPYEVRKRDLEIYSVNTHGVKGTISFCGATKFEPDCGKTKPSYIEVEARSHDDLLFLLGEVSPTLDIFIDNPHHQLADYY